jgi:SAM-dependent methyltransferase
MVAPNDGAVPPFIDEASLQRIAALLRESPTIAVLDLGVHVTPTSHPSFLGFAKLVGEIMRAREGRVLVWCDTTTDREVLAALVQSACPFVAVTLPIADAEIVKSLNRRAGFLTEEDIPAADTHVFGVPLFARPDAPPPLPAPSFYGGCPIVEQNFRLFGTDGREFACQRLMQNGEALDAEPGTRYKQEQQQALRRKLRLDQRENAAKSCAGCRFSYQGWVRDDDLRAFWITKDDCGDIVDNAERDHLFGKAIPTPHRVIKVDLGCGPVKRPGFVGIDRFPLPGVDITADINKGIPLPDDSVDYLVASHSLEHFDDLPSAIHEIHRVCKDRALVTIVAPYSATALNLANPYHVQVFNEHTARFFTNAAETALKTADYDFPSAINWGLASSDHSDWHADLRLLKCEFFYMPPYRVLDEPAKRVLRQSLNDVCEQMLLQLIVVKSPMSPAEFSERMHNTIFQEPPVVTARRAEEARAGNPNMFTALAHLPKTVSDLGENLAHWRLQTGSIASDVRATSNELQSLSVQLAVLTERLDRVERAVVENHQTIEAEGALAAKRITAINTELVRRDQQQRSKLDELEETIAKLLERLKPSGEVGDASNAAVTSPQAQADVAAVMQDVNAIAVEPDPLQKQAVGVALSREERGIFLSRAIRLYRRRAQNLTNLVSPRFSSLKKFGERSGWVAEGLRLQESNLWRNGQEWIYDVPVQSGSLTGMRLAVTALFVSPTPMPLFDFAVWSADSNKVLANAKLAPRGDLSIEPIEVQFSPVDVTRGFVRIRLLALPAVEALGIRTIEWRGLNALRQVKKVHLFCEPLYL